MAEGASEEDGRKAHADMQAALLRSFLWLIAVAALALTARENFSHSPALTAVLALALSLGALAWSYRPGAPLRPLALGFFCALVPLITNAALDLGGATGSALSFSFVPGFLAVLVLGPAWGWSVSGLMLASLAWLCVRTPLATRFDFLRLVDEAAVTVFASGLAHALHRSFRAYETAIAARREALIGLRDKRQALARAIYEQLEPLSASLVAALPQSRATGLDQTSFGSVLERLIEELRRAKALAQKDDAEPLEREDPDPLIRRHAMRVWLRLGAGMMAFFVLRNLLAGVSWIPSVFSIAFCVLLDVWLGRSEASRRLEATALAVGLLATGPMLAHIHAYGGGADAPALVVMPGTVLFTALLSQGPAAWLIVTLNLGVLVWVGFGRELPLVQSRLLGDLGLSFIVVVVALRSVFALRRRYAEALFNQAQALTLALRQHRRLAGTLFHDVSNHLQVLSFEPGLDEPDATLERAQSLSRRVARLILLSKEFLLSPEPGQVLAWSSVRLSDAVSALTEAFAPRLEAKAVALDVQGGLDLSVRAQPELLVESVLGNLLSNAIKFSPRGSRITLAATRVDSEVRILISDSGVGLPREVLERLSLDGAVPSALGTDGEQGQGYGLQLVTEHVKRMGGRLELRSRDVGGTEAAVWLALG